MPVQRSAKGQREHIKRILDQVEKKEVQVGFFESSAYEDGTPVAYVAAIQEFGYPGGSIPARPFIRPTIAQQREAWQKSLMRGYKAAINEQITVEFMLEQFGMAAAGQVKVTISKVTDPPLSPITLLLRQRKKSGEAITGRTVGNAAAAAAYVPQENRGKALGVSEKPLVDTGYLISQVQSAVVDR